MRTSLARTALSLLGLWLVTYLLILLPFGPVRTYRISGVGILSAALVATSIITFFGFLKLSTRPDTVRDDSLRSAIAASTVVTYLVFVGSVALFETAADVPEISRILMTSFTTTVGIIIAFYFGSSAYVAARSGTSEPARGRKDD